MVRTLPVYMLWFMYACGAGAGLMIISKLAPIASNQAGIKLGFLLVAVLADPTRAIDIVAIDGPTGHVGVARACAVDAVGPGRRARAQKRMVLQEAFPVLVDGLRVREVKLAPGGRDGPASRRRWCGWSRRGADQPHRGVGSRGPSFRRRRAPLRQRG